MKIEVPELIKVKYNSTTLVDCFKRQKYEINLFDLFGLNLLGQM